MESLTVSDLGERRLIARLRERFPGLALTGDDAAALELLQLPVVTTDSFYETTHFYLWWAPARVLGRRLLEAALSDLAAMGARPGWSLIALTLPDRTDVEWLESLYEGFLGREDCVMAGGEIVSGERLGVTITAIGEGAGEGDLLRRSALRPGDGLWVTGRIGRALGAPKLIEETEQLRGPELKPTVDALDQHQLEQIRAFLRPRAHFREGQMLRRLGVRCAIDISDGLLSEAGHLARESGVDVQLELEGVPFFESVADRPLAACAAGEDFVLLFGCPDSVDLSGTGFYRVGRASKGSGAVTVTRSGERVEFSSRGYDHLAGSPGPTGP
ncbi:MAG: thiamine-phosphate kinase [Candidatus Fermentibacteraceae bacterium]